MLSSVNLGRHFLNDVAHWGMLRSVHLYYLIEILAFALGNRPGKLNSKKATVLKQVQ